MLIYRRKGKDNLRFNDLQFAIFSVIRHNFMI